MYLICLLALFRSMKIYDLHTYELSGQVRLFFEKFLQGRMPLSVYYKFC